MLKHLINLIKKVVVDTNNTPIFSTTTSSITKKETLNQSPLVVDKEERIVNIIKKLQDYAAGTPPYNWEPSRFIYKVGSLNLKGTFSYLKQIAQRETRLLKTEDNFKYSMIWALGRCGNTAALSLIDRITENVEANYIKRLTLDACLHLATEGKEQLVEIIKGLLPENTLTTIVESAESGLSSEQITIFFPKNAKETMPPLFCCYLLSFEEKALRPNLIKLLREIPLTYPFFQTIRYIFKSAEFRNDYEMMGLLAYRLDTAGAAYKTVYRWHWHRKMQRHIREKVAQPEKAFSNRTKAYFQKKIIRTLVLLGEQESEGYCHYGTALLKEYEATEITPETQERYEYKRENGNYFRIDYNVYLVRQTCASWITMNTEREINKQIVPGCIAYINEPLYQRMLKGRTEPYAKLWDAHPKFVLELLTDCKSDFVANFALKIIKNHPKEAELITRSILIKLIKNPLNSIAAYTLKHIQKHLDPTNPDWTLVQSLVQAPNELLHNHLFKTIEKHPTVFYHQTDLIEALVCSIQKDIAAWFQQNATQLNLSEDKRIPLFNALLAKIQTQKTEEYAAILNQNCQLFFAKELSQTSIEKAPLLLAHPLEQVQLLGASILIAQKDQIGKIPEETIMEMMGASFSSIREKGLELFGAMPIELLLEKKDILISMAISKEPEMRKAVQPILAKTANGKPAWAQQLLSFFIPLLLQKETYGGLHADTLALLMEHLEQQLASVSEKLIWRLVNAHYREANLLGMTLLQNVDFSKAALSDIISLADHEMPAIRQYCLDYFNQNIGRIRYESTESLGLLDAKWADCRAFGFDFFDQHFKSGDWTPELLVSTCDSTHPDVQEFGKKMMLKFFDQGKGEDYLMQLSQHPNVSLQLFATNYLNEFASGNSQHFIRLKPFFKTVLCQLYKGGTTKKRIFDFIEKEAVNNQAIAPHVIEILNEVSLTMAIRDKARCIQVLHRIKKVYPELESVLRVEKIY